MAALYQNVKTSHCSSQYIETNLNCCKMGEMFPFVTSRKAVKTASEVSYYWFTTVRYGYKIFIITWQVLRGSGSGTTTQCRVRSSCVRHWAGKEISGRSIKNYCDCMSMCIGLQNVNLLWSSSSSGTKRFVKWIKNVGVCFVNYFRSGVPENRENTIQNSHLRWMPLKGEVLEWKMGL